MKLDKLATVKNTITSTVGRAGLKVSKYSPEILMTVGVVAIVGGTIAACKSTLKIEEVLDEHNQTMDDINMIAEKGVVRGDEEYTEQDAQKDKAILTIQTGWKLVKLYAPAAFLIGGGITCILSSFGIMKKRNVALMAAYRAVDEAFKDYRRRVVEEYGEDVDRGLKTGIKTYENKETGEMVEVQMDAKGLNPSIYARYFDETSTQWTRNAELNLMKLHQIQNYCNDMLRARGHLFLNEVYDELGLPRSQAGQFVGWLKEGGCDGVVDFGIYDIHRARARDFVNGIEKAILLDFNVDGPIYDLI